MCILADSIDEHSQSTTPVIPTTNDDNDGAVRVMENILDNSLPTGI